MGIPFVGINRAMRDLLGSYFFHFSHESRDLLGMSLDFSIGVVDPLEEFGVGGLGFSIHPYFV